VHHGDSNAGSTNPRDVRYVSVRKFHKEAKNTRPPWQGASKYAATCDTILLDQLKGRDEVENT
jgi:hypothetical protein